MGFLSQVDDSLVVMGIKVLHCSDLHLDANLGNVISAAQQSYISSHDLDLLKAAPLLALNNIAKTAIRENVDLVLIAGDLFNLKDDSRLSSFVRYKLLEFFRSLNEHGIYCCVSVGNHDPLKFINEISISWPENVHLFASKKPETVSLRIGDVAVDVHGVSFAKNSEERNLASQFPKKTDADFNFGVLHTNVGGDLDHSNYAPCNLETLQSFDYDYFALGHIHKREILSENPLIAYCGNHQALSPKPSECENKGVLIIDFPMPGAAGNIEFFETDLVRIHNLKMNLDTATGLENLSDEIANYLQSKFQSSDVLNICRLALKVEEYEGSIFNEDELIEIVNDSLENIFLSELKIELNSQDFEDLKAVSEFFQSINSELENLEQTNLSELYGKQLSKISSNLDMDENKFQEIKSTNFDEEIKELITNMHNELARKSK